MLRSRAEAGLPRGDSDPTAPCWGRNEEGRQGLGVHTDVCRVSAGPAPPCPASSSCLPFHEAGHCSPFSIRGPLGPV